LLEESLALYRELGREHGVQYSLYSLALLRLQSGHGSEAVSAASESLVLSHRLGDVRFAILNLFLLATLALRRGDAERAARLFGAAERERARVSLALSGTAEGELHSETHAETRGALGVERFDTVFAEGGAMALEEAIAYAIGEAPTNRDALVVNGTEEPATARGGSPLR
jgi:non-specific serine/threonine protein kinase